MALSKKQRQQVWAKTGGKCWYCGSDLPEKGWHADHVEPVIRNSYEVSIRKHQMAMEEARFGRVPEELRPQLNPRMYREHNDTIDNMVPACAPCNLFKSTFSVEFFRQELEAQIERARKSSINFRMAERFGLIRQVGEKVTFYFERLTAQRESEVVDEPR